MGGFSFRKVMMDGQRNSRTLETSTASKWRFPLAAYRRSAANCHNTSEHDLMIGTFGMKFPTELMSNHISRPGKGDQPS
ncbi:hypothetical protein T07_1505 [Trichinella nelsoni]|uniref:Uncharacterized protein n=1 Tax=Trichinella nelsoni TaxID=6336 RepID=A0A0V0S7N0_9BILA|nr:hypothetical protein T07_1505 [Trichinella nelsoni]